MYTRIVVAMALNHDVSTHLIALAEKLKSEDGTITAVHVIEDPSGIAAATTDTDVMRGGALAARKLFDEKLAAWPGIEGKLLHGQVSPALLEFAESHKADCIIMGSHKPGVVEYLIGSTAARIVRQAPCSVHMYRP